TATLIAPIALVTAIAQQANIKRTPLQTVDFPAGFSTVSVMAEIAAGSCAGRHTHPGIETSYVVEGEVVVKVEGKPEQRVKAGDSFQIPAGAVHDGCAAGAQP